LFLEGAAYFCNGKEYEEVKEGQEASVNATNIIKNRFVQLTVTAVKPLYSQPFS
jgi:hypothetical protein